MSKKKKLLAEQQAREAAAKAAAAERQKKTAAPRAHWVKMNISGPVPIARPADHIQLTPIVQPIPLVPYSTQLQPLAMYDDEDDE